VKIDLLWGDLPMIEVCAHKKCPIVMVYGTIIVISTWDYTII